MVFSVSGVGTESGPKYGLNIQSSGFAGVFSSQRWKVPLNTVFSVSGVGTESGPTEQ